LLQIPRLGLHARAQRLDLPAGGRSVAILWQMGALLGSHKMLKSRAIPDL
jgi:hypothetical protein